MPQKIGPGTSIPGSAPNAAVFREKLIPDVTEKMVEELMKRYPQRCARQGMDMFSIGFEAGAASVVETLRSTLKKYQLNKERYDVFAR